MVAVNLDDSQANDKQPLLTATGFSHFANRGNGNKVNVKVGLKQVSELKCNIAECKQHEITGPCRHEIALLQKLVLMIMRENPGEVTDYQADRALARAEMLEEFDQDALEDVKLLAQLENFFDLEDGDCRLDKGDDEAVYQLLEGMPKLLRRL
ncbi:hypothetical protein [Lactobacillus delbrueckii]|uniref:hypothetical protein n=1 Tax=Lactobacillus delbrueckii TaxID=1584 RepID=UPI001E542604|nr:hypothetical protein [Lactobacillus delbrueckii]MDA3801090.1 hypothetical protein [Lactobacillus delbrueckii]